ncbi:MAG: hypothetical protein ILO36_03260 [Abditibacteriota bacterium]|nr:hypothetical protein [Abditibacteriota bacterium]
MKTGKNNNPSRLDNIAKNMKFALLCQFLVMLVSFFSRRIFVDILGKEYLGLNSVFGDVLNLLSLAELGFADAMLYSLYKPVATNDTEKVKSLMGLFRKVYVFVGIFILTAGSLISPVSPFFVTEMKTPVDNIWFIFLLNVINTGVSYFFIYRATLLFADQKKYVEVIITTTVRTLAAGVQIAVLMLYGDYILYLAVSILATLALNVWITLQTNRMYPYLREKKVAPLLKEDVLVIRRNVFAMLLHKVGGVIIFFTDTIIMAKFVNVAAVGIYSNYMVIRMGLLGVIHPLFNSITGTMGNLNATETEERKRAAFENVMFFSAWLFGCICVTLAVLFNPFIVLWMDSETMAFGNMIVLLIVVNLYLYCMRLPVGSARNTMGLFHIDKYKVIPESVLNLALSVWWAKLWGIPGVLWGTIASTLLVPFWVEPWVVYRWGFKKSCLGFFVRYTAYFLVTALAYLACSYLCRFTHGGVLGLFEKLLVCIAACNLIYFLAYNRLREFRYLLETVRDQAGKLPGLRGRKNDNVSEEK